MIREAIQMAVARQDLGSQAARQVMLEMMSGAATPSQVGSFLTAMRMKGETEDELFGFVSAMRERATYVTAPAGSIDMCGTGGDGMHTFNVSTAASFVVAAGGVPVAKHGNRSVSSKCGSADLLAALGLPTDLGPSEVQRCLRDVGFGFMFAPLFHSSMLNVLGPRREIGVRTFFNILGPMANPAGVRRQLIGVFDPSMAGPMAKVLKRLGTERAMLVHGMGTDEITNLGTTNVVEIRGGEMHAYNLSPQSLGVSIASKEDIAGGGPVENARMVVRTLKGERSARADIVAMNAGAGLYVAGRTESVREGVERALELMREGAGYRKLKEYASVADRLEKERQERSTPDELLGMRLHPNTLRGRARGITEALLFRISSSPDGSARLAMLDDDILSDPTALSVIALTRLSSLMADGPPDFTPGRRSSVRLSEAIRAADGLAVIAEYKPRSPSSAPLEVSPPPLEMAELYESTGVAGVSVLAEPSFFSGGPELFSMFRARTSRPMLFKDFVVSGDQIRLASGLGADAVLLIAKLLSPEALKDLAKDCSAHGMEPLVEIHDEADLRKFLTSGCAGLVKLVGINCRDLRTLATDLSTLKGLKELLPEDKIAVAESGIGVPGDLRAAEGFDAVLVGSAIMRSDDPSRLVNELVAVGRRLSS
ncbi:MAG: anthranilate phosphoribosyltransferase [Euryarchaeota archaeon RBG_16_62_10]|nr:MAG: anthranilate phosphoribosyltransferase [Euryarchaeota archaeon RBG_16_62_10]